MKYKDYTWPSNPKRLEVSHRRNVREIGLVSGASVVQDLGTFCRVVRGEGGVCAPACLPQWERLVQIFQEGRPGVLTCRGIPPFRPLFALWEALEEAFPGLNPIFFYLLGGWRIRSSLREIPPLLWITLWPPGETLWSIALFLSLSVLIP